jgi:hypothetical protein
MLYCLSTSSSVNPVPVMLKKPVVSTYDLSFRKRPVEKEKEHTAVRSCSASFSFPPGSLNVDMLMTEILAQGRSTSVFAGRFHRGSGIGSGATAEGMMFNYEKEEFDDYKYCKEL